MDVHFYVYMLRCRDGSYYVGHTDDLETRLWQHQNGIGCDWTKRRRPIELVWCEVMPTRDEAFGAERRIKNWSRAKKEALVAGDWKRVGYYARPPHERDATSPLSTHAPARPERCRGAPGPPSEISPLSARPERSRGAPAQPGQTPLDFARDERERWAGRTAEHP